MTLKSAPLNVGFTSHNLGENKTVTARQNVNRGISYVHILLLWLYLINTMSPTNLSAVTVNSVATSSSLLVEKKKYQKKQSRRWVAQNAANNMESISKKRKEETLFFEAICCGIQRGAEEGTKRPTY